MFLFKETSTMSDFTTERSFLLPSFDPIEEEGDRIRRFMLFLESSGVGSIIGRYVKNEGPNGGRPSVNYHRLFATVLYGFATGRATLRKLEDAIAHDVRFIAMTQQARPDHSTICKFINKVVSPNEEAVFAAVTSAAAKEMGLSFDDAFVDGSKFEANANKYKFVWKPVTFHRRLSRSFFSLCLERGLLDGFDDEDLVRSKTVSRALSEASARGGVRLTNIIASMLLKVVEYEEKEAICGEGRKSYYKTDRDATAMCLKSDYYSGLGSNMHAAYNVQYLVCRGIVAAYSVTQSRVDSSDFIGVVESFRRNYGRYPANVCADVGYGSLANYAFLADKGIGNYVKDLSWEGNATGSRPDCYGIDGSGDGIVCLAGKPGTRTAIGGRHPKKAGGEFFVVKGCLGCPFHDYCFRFTRDCEGADEKVFEANLAFLRMKAEAERNLLSPKGIELRVNRSIQVEGAFGIEKGDYGYERLRRRGIKRVSTEVMLNVLGLSIAKLFRFYETGAVPEYWSPPPNLEGQTFKKPSAKRLSKKGMKVHANTYQK